MKAFVGAQLLNPPSSSKACGSGRSLDETVASSAGPGRTRETALKDLEADVREESELLVQL